MVLNFGWTPLFFGAHQLGLAFAEICLLWVSVVATMVAFAPVRWAALLLLPYILWSDPTTHRGLPTKGGRVEGWKGVGSK